MTARSSSTGGFSFSFPTHVAPSEVANLRWESPRVETYTSHFHDCRTAIVRLAEDTESEETDALAGLNAGDAQTAKSDDAGAAVEERRVRRPNSVGSGKAKSARTRDEFGIAAIHRVAGEDRPIAQIFHRMTAIPAITIHAAHPGNAHARADRRLRAFTSDNFADDLMPGNQLRAKRREIAFDDVQVGSADATGEDAKQ